MGETSEVKRWQAPGPPARKANKKGIISALVASLVTLGCAGAASIAFFDVTRVHLGYDSAKAAYLKEGLPWTSKDIQPGAPLPDSQNAAPLIKRVCDSFATLGAAPPYEIVDSKNIGEHRAYFAGRAELFDSVAAELKAKPGLAFSRDWSLGASLAFPEFAQLKRLVKELAKRAEIKTLDGDLQGALSDFAAASDLAARVDSDEVLIGALVSVACRDYVCGSARRSAALVPKNPSFAAALEQSIRPLGREIDFARTLRGEAYMHVWALRNLQALGGVAGIYSPNGGGESISKVTSFSDKGDVSGVIERSMAVRSFEFWTEFAKEAKKRPHDPIHLSRYLDRKASETAGKDQSSYALLKVLNPVFGQAGTAIVKSKATVLATRAALLAWSEKAKGRNVSSLKDIPGGPWIDPFTDSEFKAKFEREKVLIWSLGRDKVDQGGMPESQAPARVGDKRGDDLPAAIPDLSLARSD